MAKWKRKRAKDGEQRRLQICDEHRTMDREQAENSGQRRVLEESSQRLQLPPGSGLPRSEDMPQEQETRPRTSITREDQQASDDRIGEKPAQNAGHQSQNAQPVQVPRGQQSQQHKANGPSEHSQLPLSDSTPVQQGHQFQPQGKIAAPETIHSQPYNTDTTQVHPRQQFQSQSTTDAIESAQDPSPKKSGTRSRITQAFRQKSYSPSHEEKASSERKRLEKGSSDRKRLENGPRDQKKLPSDPSTSFSTQLRAEDSKLIPRKSQGRSDVPLARQESSQNTPVFSQKESSPLRNELRPDQASKRAVPSRSDEDVDTHAWERHLPQSADDATIQHEVLTLFEFIEHHVDDYYYDRHTKISQGTVDQLTELQSPYLPYGLSLEDLLDLARYQTPIIKHCLINLVVSGMSFQEPAPFPLLPEEFTVLPRAIRKETVDTGKKLYHDQAFSKLRSLCAFLRPNAQHDPDYTRKLDETVIRAVTLCSNAFAPWEARDSDPQKRHEHLISLLHKAARVGVLLFTQPSTFLFDWTSSQKATSTSAIQVWPRLLRTSNHKVEPLPRPQVIVEGSSQHIGVEMSTSHPISSAEELPPSHRARDSTDVHDVYGMNRQDTHFTRQPQPHTFGGPSELPAPQGFVSATVQGPHNPPYLFPTPKYPEHRDQDPDYHAAHGAQSPPYQYNPAPKHSEQRDQDPEFHGVHSIITSPQHRASNQDVYSLNMQSRASPPRKPVPNAQADFKDAVAP